jgi:hypothetical protein
MIALLAINDCNEKKNDVGADTTAIEVQRDAFSVNYH